MINNNYEFIKHYQKPLIATSYFALMMIFYAVFFPGAMTKDTIVQLSQAITGQYADWHPPIMAFVWSLLLKSSFGLGGLLLLHLTMLWGASFLFYLWASKSGYKYSAIFLVIPLLPWVINFEFVLWKDVGLVYSWLLCIGLALNYDKEKKYSILIVFCTAVFFIYGFLVRGNAAAGAIFLLPFLIVTLFNKCSMKVFICCFFTVFILQATLPRLTNSALSATESKAFTYIMIDDVVALKMKGLGITESVFSEAEITELHDCKLLQSNKVGAGICNISKMKDLVKNNYFELKEEWKTTVAENPLEYLLYRADAFSTFIRSPFSKTYYTSEFGMLKEPYYVVNAEYFHDITYAERKELTLIQQLISYYPRAFAYIFRDLFKPYFWLLIAFISSFLLYKKRSNYKTPFWMMPLSGVSYMSGYILFTAAPDFRYAYWLCLITTLSVIVLVFSKKKVDSRCAL